MGNNSSSDSSLERLIYSMANNYVERALIENQNQYSNLIINPPAEDYNNHGLIQIMNNLGVQQNSNKELICPICNKRYPENQTMKANLHFEHCALSVPQPKNRENPVKIPPSKSNISPRFQFLRKQLEELKINWDDAHVKFNISRKDLLYDSVQQIFQLNGRELRSEFQINFIGEKAQDAGGLTKEWLNLAVKEILTSDLGIFAVTNTAEKRYRVSSTCSIPEFYLALGKFLGKAILNNIPVSCPLSFVVLKQLLNQKVDKEDVKYIDEDVYKAIKFMESNSIEGIFYETFSVNYNGTVHEFYPGGRNIQLNDSNKELYIFLRVDYELNLSISDSIRHIKEGIESVFPISYLQNLTVQELDSLICGSQTIHLAEWKKFTQYKGEYHSDHQVIRWFWETLQEFSQDDLHNLLTFVTGSGQVPLEGFEFLTTHRGEPAKFTIEPLVFFRGSLPRAHTCFNRLDLPVYRNKEEVKSALKEVITNHRFGFNIE